MSNIVNVTISKKHLIGPLAGLETTESFYHDNRVPLGWRIGDRMTETNRSMDRVTAEWEVVAIGMSPRPALESPNADGQTITIVFNRDESKALLRAISEVPRPYSAVFWASLQEELEAIRTKVDDAAKEWRDFDFDLGEIYLARQALKEAGLTTKDEKTAFSHLGAKAATLIDDPNEATNALLRQQGE